MYGRIVLGVDGAPLRAPARGGQGERPASATDAELAADALKELCDDVQGGRQGGRPASRSRRTRSSSCAARSRPCSAAGTAPGPSPTASASASATTSARRSTCRRWCSATATTTRGTGVGFTRNAATGENKPYGDFLVNAQGEDVVAGIRNTEDLDALGDALPEDPRRAARRSSPASSAHYQRHVRHRVHHRAGQALDAPDPRRQAHRRRRAADGRRHDQGHRQGRAAGRSPSDEALQRVTADHLDQVLHPQFAGKRQGASPRAWPRRRARRSARCTSPPTTPPTPPSAARRSSSCAARPAPRTSTA